MIISTVYSESTIVTRSTLETVLAYQDRPELARCMAWEIRCLAAGGSPSTRYTHAKNIERASALLRQPDVQQKIRQLDPEAIDDLMNGLRAEHPTFKKDLLRKLDAAIADAARANRA